ESARPVDRTASPESRGDIRESARLARFAHREVIDVWVVLVAGLRNVEQSAKPRWECSRRLDLNLRSHVRRSVEEVRLLASYSRPQRLELKPAGFVTADLLLSEDSILMGDLDRSPCCFGQQLSLTAALHGYEPPGRFVDSPAHGQQAVILQDEGLLVAQSLGDAGSFCRLIHNAS